jgi:tRNA threonylcarbamoyladenosine biosynthesis protein TsaE
MTPLVILPVPTPEGTAQIATRLGRLLGAGDTVLLHGPVGAGKSHFARALIKSRLAIEGRIEDVPSPTFTLVQTYALADVEIWHADLYRLHDPAECLELGLDQAFETAICLVEWPDRLGSLMPDTALHLKISQGPEPEARVLTFAGHPDWAERLTGLA